MRPFFIIFSIFTCCSIQAAHAELVDDYINQARQAQLGQHPAWLALLHYKKETLTGRFISQADDELFFKSPQGKTDPEAELEADIKAFFEPSASGHAQCFLPARWHWLKQQLGLSSEYDVSCPKLDKWMDSVSTDKLTLVFPAMYLGNPGSTFGHTFLRFDGSDSIMLSQTINYAAAYDPEDSMPAYVYNGLFGGYQGVFLIRQYFETVQLYSDIENRDIWEYQLDYSPDEIRQLARHTWEVTGIRFDYFFFRENCSYRLLGMLDAVKPEGELTSGDAFPLYAIPVDTVRALEEKQLILKKQYRASLASQLQAGFTYKNEEESAWVIQLAEGELSVAELEARVGDESQRVDIYELAYTLLQFRNQASAQVAEDILEARSLLLTSTMDSIDETDPPEIGHESARFALGGGDQNGDSYMDVVLRPAFHDLVDAPLGYVEGSEINVLDTRLRWFPDDNKMRLESLRFFNIVSLTPVSDWYTTPSWQLDIRLERTRLDEKSSDMALVTRGGGGYSGRWANTTVFAMALLEANISDDYEDDYSLLAGAQLGASILLGFGQALFLVESDEPVSGFELDRDSVSAELQYNVARNTAIRAGYRKNRYEFFDDEDWFVRLQQYF
jgi:hypothetical protein